MTLASSPAPPLLPTWNGRRPADVVAMRGAELPGIVALPIRMLTPWLPEPIWSAGAPDDVGEVRARTRRRVEAMDWSMIRERARVNLLANPHGFALCGMAYVAMLEEIRTHVERETGATVRLRIAESMGHIENPDWMKIFDLPERFGDAKECPQIDAGTEISTRVGRMWVNRKLFQCDHFIHTHVTEMREGYLHRMLDRLYKPFGMGYTRVETRSGYHFGYGPRTGQLVARAIFESDFVQERYTGTVVLNTSPEGVVDVDGANDLAELNSRVSLDLFRNYGTLIRLMAEIDECIVVFDGHGNTVYCYAGGIPFDVLYFSNVDFLDLDNPAILTPMLPESARELFGPYASGENAAVKALVVNYMAGGIPYTYLIDKIPTLVVGPTLWEWLTTDPSACMLSRLAARAEDLPAAMHVARNIARTDKVLVYDGLQGAMHVSESLADHLLARAPDVAEHVRSTLLPRWLAQRNLA
ncbi:MAG: hypothetical protein WEB06_21270 [Actinomycetota bacterium]